MADINQVQGMYSTQNQIPPAYVPATATVVQTPEAPHKSSVVRFVTGSVTAGGVRIPNIVLILVLLIIAYCLYEHNKHKTISLAQLGGSLNISSSPGSNDAFFREIGIYK